MWIEPCKDVDGFMAGLIRRNAGQPEFHQAVKEFVSTVMPFVQANPKYQQHQILERLTEPDRAVIFRVTWQDDRGTSERTALGEFSSIIPLGPTKAV